MDFVSSNIDFLHKSCEDVLPSSAQAQAQLEAELVLILIYPAPTHPSRIVVKQLEISKTCLAKIVALSHYEVR